MSLQLDAHLAESGTRFRIFPQHKSLAGFGTPEVVYVNAAPGTIRPGPEDEAMYVVDAKGKTPYSWPSGPPYAGERYPAAKPDANGHFEHIAPSAREFSAATMFATVRRVLDIWEDYFGRELPWFFRVTHPRLEMIPRVEWDNAQSGYGFIEFGFGRTGTGGIDHQNPYCENFDVLAHELGHSIKNGVIGWPAASRMTLEYRGHHEAFADLVAIVASLHFDSVVESLLQNTKGNLFSVNELSRVGELSKTRQIRLAFNYKKMSTVNRGEEHDLSEPFTGGAFDTLVEIYEQCLVDQGIIPKDLGDRSYHAPAEALPQIQQEFEAYYARVPQGFKAALLEARDAFARLMARAWDKTSKDDLYFSGVVRNMIDADQELNGGKFGGIIRDAFAWREITTSVAPELLRMHRVTSCAGEQPAISRAKTATGG